MSNLDPNRYTDTEAERLLQVLLEAAGTGNRVDALRLASNLFGNARISGRARDAAEAVFNSLVEDFVGRLHLDAESSQQVLDSAVTVWNFFRTHHSTNMNQIYGVLDRLSVIPPEQAAVPADIERTSAVSSLTSASGAVDVAYGNVPLRNSVGEVGLACEPGANFGVASAVGAAQQQNAGSVDSIGPRVHSVGSDASSSCRSVFPNSVDSNFLVTQEVDEILQQEQRNIPAVEDEDEEDEQKPRAFKRSNDDDDDKNNHKKKKPDNED